MEEILNIENVSAGYNGRKIIENVDLKIYEKDFLGIIGPNGGGKSTLIKVILRLLKPMTGKVTLKKGISTGYLPQFSVNDRKFPITVKEAVLSGLESPKKLFRRYNTQDRLAADNILENFSLSEYSSAPVGELSGGQMQRVFLCRAMISHPDLLILDEPNSFVDHEFSEDLYKILKELNEEITILMVSHDTGVITSYVKNIACVNRTLHYHPGSDITSDMIDKYTCPVELITHGSLPHRVLREHGGEKK